MRQCLLLAICFAAASIQPSPSFAQSTKKNPEPASEEIITLQFAGGPLTDYLRAFQEASQESQREPVNVVVNDPKLAKEVMLPQIALEQVDIETPMELLSQIVDPEAFSLAVKPMKAQKPGRPTFLLVLRDRRKSQTAGLLGSVSGSGAPAGLVGAPTGAPSPFGGPSEPGAIGQPSGGGLVLGGAGASFDPEVQQNRRLEVLSASELVPEFGGDPATQTPDQRTRRERFLATFLSAVETAFELRGKKQEQRPQIRFHEDSGLFFVSGGEEDILLVQNLLERLSASRQAAQDRDGERNKFVADQAKMSHLMDELTARNETLQRDLQKALARIQELEKRLQELKQDRKE